MSCGILSEVLDQFVSLRCSVLIDLDSGESLRWFRGGFVGFSRRVMFFGRPIVESLVTVSGWLAWELSHFHCPHPPPLEPRLGNHSMEQPNILHKAIQGIRHVPIFEVALLQLCKMVRLSNISNSSVRFSRVNDSGIVMVTICSLVALLSGRTPGIHRIL